MGRPGRPARAQRRATSPATLAALALLMALPVLGALVPGVGAQGEPSPAPQPASDPMTPVQVALDALPTAVRSAIAQTREELLADVAITHLELTRDYVQGFSDLPANREALADPAVRASYGWTESAVEVVLAIPVQFERAEAASAACESYGNGMSLAQARSVVASGRAALARLKALHAELQQLNRSIPAPVEPAAFHEAVALLGEWLDGRGKEIEACLDLLALEVGIVTPDPGDPVLTAIIVPERIHPGGQFRVLGTWSGDGPVAVQGGSLGLQESRATDEGRWAVAHRVPRQATLGLHDVTASAGGQRIDLELEVRKAPVTLRIEAPRTVGAEGSFLVRVFVTSLAGTQEVDRAQVRLTWRGDARPLGLSAGLGADRLAAGGPGTFTLEATYPGTEALEGAYASVQIEVQATVGRPPADAGGGLLGAGGLFGAGGPLDPRGLFGPGAWFDWLLLLLILLLILLALWRLLRKAARDRPLQQGIRPDPPPVPDWEGSRSFALALGLLFDLLRRLRIVPPGRTVREWSLQGHARPEVAEAFEHVRYGARDEPPTLTARGTGWVRALWRRWGL